MEKAAIVFDHFHVIKMMNEKISDFRRELHNNTADKLRRSVLKGTRWLLLTARENLATKEKSVERLRQALEVNKPLATVYYMKEGLRQVLGWLGDKKAAEWPLTSWLEMARNSGIEMLLKVAKTLERHLEDILAYFDFDGLSTGPLEGTNNNIKTMQRKSYGNKDRSFSN